MAAVVDKMDPETADELESDSIQPAAPIRPIIRDRWPEMSRDAYYGLSGDAVRAIDPYTEGDPVSTLIHLLVAYGNMIGDCPHVQVQNDKHPARLYAAVVGDTAKGRKGTSWGAPRDLLSACDPDWAKRIRTGLSSGEGLIYHVRDASNDKDPGELDKRILLLEPEFSSMLRIMGREGNSLSGVLRNAWDSGYLATLTRNSPLTATGSHVSLIGHTTAEELRKNLSSTECANGFGNRILWVMVRRSKLLPDGAEVPTEIMESLLCRLRASLNFIASQESKRIQRNPDAAELWRRVYPALSEGKPGLAGALCGRGEAQAVRLSLLYALLDCSPQIRPEHIRAALAVWEYCEASVRYIFGDRTGDLVTDRILDELERHPDGMTGEDLYNLFGKRRSSEKDRAVDMLLRTGRITSQSVSTPGRPITVYRLR